MSGLGGSERKAISPPLAAANGEKGVRWRAAFWRGVSASDGHDVGKSRQKRHPRELVELVSRLQRGDEGVQEVKMRLCYRPGVAYGLVATEENCLSAWSRCACRAGTRQSWHTMKHWTIAAEPNMSALS